MSTQPAPKPKPMFQRLEEFYAAKVYATREQFEQETGEKCRPWNPKRRPQGWRKKLPGAGIEGSDGRELATYKVLDPATANTATPRLKTTSIAVEDSETVNIPPRGEGMTNVPGADAPEILVPIEINPETQMLVSSRATGGLPGSVYVRNLDVSAPVSLTPGETLIVELLNRVVLKTGA